MKDVADALKFVKGAVARKDYVPELTHFRIKDQRVIGFNGKIALCHPIDLDLTMCPKAVFFEKALAAVPEDQPVSLDITGTGRLAVRAGAFKVFVPCIDEIPEGVFKEPEGEMHPIASPLLEILEDLMPFIAEDASRPWAQSVFFRGQSAFATNNQIVVERWCPTPIAAHLVVPLDAVRELLRIGIDPVGMQLSQNAVTFHYANGAWLRSQLLEDTWPERLGEVIAQSTKGLVPAPANFNAEVKRLTAFITDSGCIHIDQAALATTTEENAGAAVTVDSPIGKGMFHIQTLQKIAAVATRVDFWSVPAVFTAPRIRGVAMNMRG